MQVRFRIATEKDVQGIVDLCNECFDEHTVYEEAEKKFKEKDNNQIYIIGECDGTIIAHTKVAVVPTIFEGMETFAILNHVCVRPDYRKHKIASKMLEVTRKVCEEKHCISLKLWSKNFRIPAHKCYEKFGFKKIGATFFEMDIRK